MGMKSFNRLRPRYLLVAVLAGMALALWSGAALALDSVNQSWFGSVAIKGTDPVAYFTQGRPMEGSKAHQFIWKGAKWRFANAKHREMFAANPERYAPQYGGYCAWAVSQGYTAGIDPDAWKIVESKLYLNNSKSVQAQWLADMKALIQQADVNWPRLLTGS